MEEKKKVGEIKSNTGVENQQEEQHQKNKVRKFGLNSVIFLVLVVVMATTVVYLMRSSENLFSFLQTKVVVDISTVIKDIQQREKLVLFEVSYEDVINVSNERVGEEFGMYYVLKEGIYRYSGTVLFGIDLSEFDESDIDKVNKIIRLPRIRVLDVVLSFDTFYENYAIEPKIAGIKLGYLDVKVPERVKNTVLKKYTNLAEELLKENSSRLFVNRKTQIEKIGLDMFKRLFVSFTREEGYKILYKE